MQITVYDGAGVIGGNKIFVESKGTNLSFDFGISYSTYGKYYEEFLKPRPARGTIDFLKLGLLPPLKGIYRSDLFPNCFDPLEYFDGHPHHREIELSGILLSHAHLDHSGHISFLKENIPIYCSPLTAAIAKAVQDTSKIELDKEVCYTTPREENELGYLSTVNFQKKTKEGAARGRPFYLVNPSGISDGLQQFWSKSSATREINYHLLQESSKVGDLELKRYTVDHSIFGSSAFAVKTTEGWVVYTGDMRLSGKKGHLTRSFAKEVSQLNPLVLITEGTRIKKKDEQDTNDLGFSDDVDEELVFQKCLMATKQAKGLVIADFGPRNLERLLSFLEIARQVGRKLLVMSKDAYILEAVSQVIPADVRSPEAEQNIWVYRNVKSKLDLWEKLLFERYTDKLIDGRGVRQRQKDFIVCMSFLDVDELVDICPEEGSVYIYSSSEAYSEEQKIDFGRLLNWLRLFKIQPVGVPDPENSFKVKPEERGYHVSGHMPESELLTIVRMINPKIVVPVHTEHPEFFAENLPEYQVMIPERGNPLQI